MLVIHVSKTPLAGSPIRIVNALNAHSSVAARLINLAPNAYGTRAFPEDLEWGADRDQAQDLLARADIVHFHHFFDFGSTSNPFGFDFLNAMRPSAHCLIQWHSSPEFTARDSGVPESSIHTTDIPQMVVAQYHERYYPSALPVPLILGEPGEQSKPRKSSTDRPRILFSPTRQISAHAARWETKGAPEVRTVLRGIERAGLARVEVVQNLSFEECQQRRAGADVVIDDVVTGSFHTTSLESLAMGKATIAFLDSRTQAVLAQLTGSNDLPIVNVHLAQLRQALEALCAEPQLVRDIGAFSADWMRSNYSADTMIEHYVNGYEQLLDSGCLQANRFQANQRAKQWLYRDLPDLVWSARKKALYRGALYEWLGRSTKGVRSHPTLKAIGRSLGSKSPQLH